MSLHDNIFTNILVQCCAPQIHSSKWEEQWTTMWFTECMWNCSSCLRIWEWLLEDKILHWRNHSKLNISKINAPSIVLWKNVGNLEEMMYYHHRWNINELQDVLPGRQFYLYLSISLEMGFCFFFFEMPLELVILFWIFFFFFKQL